MEKPEANRGMPSEGRTVFWRQMDIPVLASVDVIVAGATCGGAAAALRAVDMGQSAFVISSQPYLGEDVCGTYQGLFEPPDGDHPLLNSMFPAEASPSPFQVKKALEDKLVDRDIPFLYSSQVVDLLFNQDNSPAGVVIANRTGMEAILGSVVIDCTPLAAAAKRAGVNMVNVGGGETAFRFITVGNHSQSSLQNRPLPRAAVQNGEEFPVREYIYRQVLHDWSYPEVCRVEQKMRSEIWDYDQIDAADSMFYVPPFQIEAASSMDAEMPQEAGHAVDALRPENTVGIFVLGPCMSADRGLVPTLLQPKNAIQLGEFVGAAAAEESKQRTAEPVGGGPSSANTTASVDGNIEIAPAVLRPGFSERTVVAGGRDIPVVGEYDVVIMGGGTAGANAAIGAARHGAKTLVMEYLHSLGGTGTAGYIGRYWDGFREGFTKEIDDGVSSMAPEDHPRQKKDKYSEWDVVWKSEWYRQEALKAHADIWYGVMGCGAVVDNDTVKGVLTATSHGLGVVLGQIIIDSTGSGDIAIAAGADYGYTDNQTVAVQGAGLSPANLGDHYNNTDWTFIDDSDVFDVTRLFAAGKAKYGGSYDIGKLPQTRERRRIVGEHEVSVLDILNHRTYEDTISFHMSSFDTHGFTIHPFFTIKPPLERHSIYEADVPLRSLLPRGLQNIVVTGLGASAHRDAMPVIRMQPCLQNQGYSVGYLASAAVSQGTSVQELDLKQVQAYLVEKGILPRRVLEDTEGFHFTEAEFADAVGRLTDNFSGLEVLLTDEDRARRFLKKALADAATDEQRCACAQVLAMLGEADGIEYVLNAVEAHTEWDEGWDYTGMGQFGPCMSPLDSLLIALGESKGTDVLPAILAKAQLLTPDDAFSHFRAAAWACETIGSPDAAPALARLLSHDGFSGHHVTTVKQARDGAVPERNDVSQRNRVLKELHVARALYRCGDHQGRAAEILHNYARDLHGHYFRHAWGILQE